jgi:hypothetical protein
MKRIRGREETIFVGIDNGVSGTIGIIDTYVNKTYFLKTPHKSEQSATKKKQKIGRIRHEEFYRILVRHTLRRNAKLILERPFTGKFNKANTSAGRALESMLIAIERLELSFRYADSKEWQKQLLPKGVKGSENLKEASMQIGCRMFPEHRVLIEEHGDADGLLLAEHLRREYI